MNMKKNILIYVGFFLANVIIVNFVNVLITTKEILFFHIFLATLFLFTQKISYKIEKPTLTLSLNFFRIAASVVFVFLFANKEKAQIFNFFFCYFVYLFSSVFVGQKTTKK